MKRTIDLHVFINEFQSFDGRYEQLGGREGLRLLFQYLEEREIDSGEAMELDVIGLCCDYACDTPDDILSYYGDQIEIEPGTDYDTARDTELEVYDAITGFLEYHTTVVGRLSDGRLLYQQF